MGTSWFILWAIILTVRGLHKGVVLGYSVFCNFGCGTLGAFLFDFMETTK